MTMWTPELKAGRPKYQAIVEAMIEDIDSGRLPAGSQLPPQRDLARALGLSLGTVTRAYAAAEERGVARGEVGRGTYVGEAGGGPLAYGNIGQSVAGGVNLGMNWPLEHMNPDLGAALRQVQRGPDLANLLRYQSNLGMPRHRAAGAMWIAAQGWQVKPECIAVCSGAQHAMTVTVSSLAKSGETILAESVTYPGLLAVARFLGVKVAPVEMDGEGILPDAFERACETRRPKAIYLVPTLQNPTTAIMSKVRREAVVAVARKWGVPIIEDAIHHLLVEPTVAPPLIASLAPELTYLIASPSKVVAGGLRVAFLAAPGHALRDLSQQLWATTWMAAPLVVEVMSQFIFDGTALATAAAKREESLRRVELARSSLAPYDLQVADYGFHAWLPLPSAWSSSEEFARAAAEQGVTLAPSSGFHVGSSRPPMAVRLSMSTPSTREVLERGLLSVKETLDLGPGSERVIL